MINLALVWKDLGLWLATYSDYVRRQEPAPYLAIDDLAILYGWEIDDHFPGMNAIGLLRQRVSQEDGRLDRMDEATIVHFDNFHRSLPRPKMRESHPAAVEMLKEALTVVRVIGRLESN